MNDSLSQQEMDELLSDMSQQLFLTQELAKMKQGESSIILLGCGRIHSTYDVF
jgi:flagellar motor switch protein FliM